LHRKLHSCRKECLIKSLWKGSGNSHHLASGTHLGSEQGVYPWKLVKGEHGLLYGNMGRDDLLDEAEVPECHSGHDLGSNFCKGHTDGLADKRNGSRRAGVHFEYIDGSVLDGELYVHESNHAELHRKCACRLSNGLEDIRGKRVCRQNE